MQHGVTREAVTLSLSLMSAVILMAIALAVLAVLMGNAPSDAPLSLAIHTGMYWVSTLHVPGDVL